MFKRACKKQQKLRLLIEGASGSGKTYSALLIAKSLGKKIAVIDTEKGSASLYDKLVNFDTCQLTPDFTPEKYIEAIKEAEKAGYDVLIIDSITHEWSGKGGCLDIQNKLGGRFSDWAKVTPRHNNFLDAITNSKMHIISTSRTKTDYEISKDDKGKQKVEKIGLKTEQREGLDYEFTLVFRLNENHIATATKDRTSLFSSLDCVLNEEIGTKILGWLNDGEENLLDSDSFIFEKIAEINNIENLETYWKQHKDVVCDKEAFKNICASRKTFISEREVA